jgi:DNA-binding CsgD family transcriptional regulator
MLVESSLPTAPDVLALAHARFLAQTGKITRALRDLEAMPEPDHDLVRVSWLAARLDCRLARGDLTAAGALADRLAGLAGDDDLVGAVALHGLGEHTSALGDAERALTHFLDAGSRLGRGEDDPETVPWRAGAALALVRTRRAREADTLAQEHLGLARRTDSAYVVAQALRIVAATESGGSRVATLREARLLLDQVPAERLAAQIDTDLGVLLSLDPDPSAQAEAVALLRGAEDYAGREDLFPLQHRIRENLRRLGQEPRRIRSETLATLTATEQKAARMAAAGLTNREIAESMQVTVKAVEWHLSHVYRKLGIRGRRGLAASLGAH